MIAMALTLILAAHPFDPERQQEETGNHDQAGAGNQGRQENSPGGGQQQTNTQTQVPSGGW